MAVDHFETALRIPSSFNQAENLFQVHFNLIFLFIEQGAFSNAQTGIEYIVFALDKHFFTHDHQ